VPWKRSVISAGTFLHVTRLCSGVGSGRGRLEVQRRLVHSVGLESAVGSTSSVGSGSVRARSPLWGGIVLVELPWWVSLRRRRGVRVAARSFQALAALPDRSPRGRPQSPRLASVRNQVDERENQDPHDVDEVQYSQRSPPGASAADAGASERVCHQRASQKTRSPRECRGIQLA